MPQKGIPKGCVLLRPVALLRLQNVRLVTFYSRLSRSILSFFSSLINILCGVHTHSDRTRRASTATGRAKRKYAEEAYLFPWPSQRLPEKTECDEASEACILHTWLITSNDRSAHIFRIEPEGSQTLEVRTMKGGNIPHSVSLVQPTC